MAKRYGNMMICDDPSLSWCGKCKRELPLESFFKQSNRWSGISNHCRECHGVKNPRIKRVACPPGHKQCCKCAVIKPYDDYCLSSKNKDGRNRRCRKCVSEYKKIYHKENAVELRVKGKKNYYDNRSKRLEHSKIYAKRRPEVGLAAKRKYKARNRMKLAKYAQNIRDLKEQGDITPESWQQTLELFNNCCAYCNQPFNKLTMDHFRPVSKGGTHTIDNVVPACQSCNSRKHDALIFDWIHRFKKAA